MLKTLILVAVIAAVAPRAPPRGSCAPRPAWWTSESTR